MRTFPYSPTPGSPNPAIDLNCDMGEGSPADARLMPLVTSANIACGGHAGDEQTMRDAVRMALAHGVNIGAHPSFPDRAGFGRRAVHANPEQVRADVAAQIRALARVASAAGAFLRHVKPHGALYNDAVSSQPITEAVGAAIADIDPTLIVVVLAGSRQRAALGAMNLRVAQEAFIDRAYTPEGTLVSRDLPGALITDPHVAAVRAVRMVRDGTIIAVDGTELRLQPDTLCVHSDTPGSVEIARVVREALSDAGIALVPMWEVVAKPQAPSPKP